jgi:peptidoglycan/LPS O-acetylase OafA/YrhL
MPKACLDPGLLASNGSLEAPQLTPRSPSQSGTRSGRAHHGYIDALRGFAFLGVLTVHTSQQVETFHLRGIPSAGMYGVQLFFVLSALALLGSLSDRNGTERFPMRNFFLRRFFRIAPLFWCGIVFYTLLEGTGPRPDAPNGLGIWHLISTALFLHGWTPATINSVVPGGWSIAVEAGFYLCLPFLAKRLGSAWASLVTAFYWLLASVVLSRVLPPLLSSAIPANEHHLIPVFLFFWLPSQLPVFLIGFTIHHLLRDERVSRFLAAPRRSLLLTAFAMFGLLGLTQMRSGLIPVHVLYAATFGILILALATKPWRILINPLSQGLGVISFSCYITHFAALKFSSRLLHEDMFATLPASLMPAVRFTAVGGLTLAITGVASIFTYVLIEKPGIRLGARFIRRLEATASSEKPQHGPM